MNSTQTVQNPTAAARKSLPKVTAGTPSGEGHLPSASAYYAESFRTLLPSANYNPVIVNGQGLRIGPVEVLVADQVCHVMGRTAKTLTASQEEMRAYTEGHMAAVSRAAAFAAALVDTAPVATTLAEALGGQWTLTQSFGAENFITAEVLRGEDRFIVVVNVGKGTIRGMLCGASSPDALHTGVLAAAILGASEVSFTDPEATETELAALITTAGRLGFGLSTERRTTPLRNVRVVLGGAEITDLDQALAWLKD